MTELNREVQNRKVDLLVDRTTDSVPAIVDVVMSEDLRKATVIWVPPVERIPMSEREQLYWLGLFEQCKGRLRKTIGLRIRSRYVPELSFELDEHLLEESDVDKETEYRHGGGDTQ